MKDRITNAILFGLAMSIPVILLSVAIIFDNKDFAWVK